MNNQPHLFSSQALDVFDTFDFEFQVPSQPMAEGGYMDDMQLGGNADNMQSGGYVDNTQSGGYMDDIQLGGDGLGAPLTRSEQAVDEMFRPEQVQDILAVICSGLVDGGHMDSLEELVQAKGQDLRMHERSAETTEGPGSNVSLGTVHNGQAGDVEDAPSQNSALQSMGAPTKPQAVYVADDRKWGKVHILKASSRDLEQELYTMAKEHAQSERLTMRDITVVTV
ncbi:hypothetical protein PAXRUDRAFT_7909 [Paxillus rubicundulus Ve08.2h10]|uniref:Uncharacterized protein n=1 Tax=Paxillus rubicundulus Ve08.2h10 TaxID=930991 RepID=A0A0D0E6X8_9AGAM|nr:hypothetical protein PAXRUDRAFT_7909 [Paxillus rubicundulus Ve08.2h10]